MAKEENSESSISEEVLVLTVSLPSCCEKALETLLLLYVLLWLVVFALLLLLSPELSDLAEKSLPENLAVWFLFFLFFFSRFLNASINI